MYLLDGQPISPDAPFTHDGVNYPANWIRLASPADRAAIGITEVIEDPQPDDFYQSVVPDPVNHGQWIVTPYTPEEMKPKLDAYSRQQRDARTLAGIYYIIDAEELFIPTDQQTRDYFFNYRIIQDRPTPPVQAVYDSGTRIYDLTETQLLEIEQAMEDRVQGCLLTQLDLQTEIEAGTVTTKEEIDDAYAAVP